MNDGNHITITGEKAWPPEETRSRAGPAPAAKETSGNSGAATGASRAAEAGGRGGIRVAASLPGEGRARLALPGRAADRAVRAAPRLQVPGALRARAARGRGHRGGGAGTPGPGGDPWGARREAAACPGLGGWGEWGGEMDKLTIISGCLFLAADIFAIASIANPDWINTGESAGERRGPGKGDEAGPG